MVSPPQPLVADASVVLKWEFDDEEHVAQAVALRNDFLIVRRIQLYAPHLYVYEIANGVTVATRRGRIDPSQGSFILNRLLLAAVTLRHPPPDRVYALAIEFGLSAYDAAYAALAETIQSELWTGDRRFYDAVSPALAFARWIGDYAPQAG